MEKKGVCYICGAPLMFDENDTNCYVDDYLDEEDMSLHVLKCKECGTEYHYYISKENDPEAEDDYVSCGYQGFGNCAHCGGNVIWSGDFMRSDFENDPSGEYILPDDDDAIVRSLTCGHCGCPIEVYEPTPNEMKSGEFPFWHGQNEED